MFIYRLHPLRRALWVSVPGDDRPGLGYRIDTTFVIHGGAKPRAIIVIRAQIPFSIPSIFLERFVDIYPLGAIFACSFGVTPYLTDLGKIAEGRGKKPPQPDTFPFSKVTDTAHAIVPIVCTHQGNPMGTGSYPFGDGAAAV